MAKLKIYEKAVKPISKRAMYCWWFANLFNIVNNGRNLRRIKSQVRYYRRLVREAPEKKDLFNDKFNQLKAAQ